MTFVMKWVKGYDFDSSNILNVESLLPFITPPRNRGGGIFSLQIVCLCVCPAVLVNKIPAEGIHQFGRSFH